jgi:hypothetical protein
MLIALHAFIKKTQKTAPEDLAAARQTFQNISARSLLSSPPIGRCLTTAPDSQSSI